MRLCALFAFMFFFVTLFFKLFSLASCFFARLSSNGLEIHLSSTNRNQRMLMVSIANVRIWRQHQRQSPIQIKMKKKDCIKFHLTHTFHMIFWLSQYTRSRIDISTHLSNEISYMIWRSRLIYDILRSLIRWIFHFCSPFSASFFIDKNRERDKEWWINVEDKSTTLRRMKWMINKWFSGKYFTEKGEKKN